MIAVANLNIDRVNSSLTSAICCVPRKAESLVHAYDSADSDIDCIESELRKDYYYTSVLRDFIPPGTVTAVDTSATAVIDFSAYDFSLLTDDLTGTFNITLLNGTVLQIVDISGNFFWDISDILPKKRMIRGSLTFCPMAVTITLSNLLHKTGLQC